ncbi:hypothetical protein FRB97_007739 [Tulasnella sp. 331]|nr:hypothetical protein FRB97_007739 [Tulasnella sp. 331]
MKAAALIVQPYCDAIDINLGCPQTYAKTQKIGAYLLERKDWPLIESIVAGLARAVSIPVHAKIRLCNPASATAELAVKLAAAGASVIAVHARHVSAERRRQGLAKLEWVTHIRQAIQDAGLGSRTKVISNGNVRNYADCIGNLKATGAAGVMIGEALLGDPSMLSRTNGEAPPSPAHISAEYLALCSEYTPPTASIIRQHIKTFFGSRNE